MNSIKFFYIVKNHYVKTVAYDVKTKKSGFFCLSSKKNTNFTWINNICPMLKRVRDRVLTLFSVITESVAL